MQALREFQWGLATEPRSSWGVVPKVLISYNDSYSTSEVHAKVRELYDQYSECRDVFVVCVNRSFCLIEVTSEEELREQLTQPMDSQRGNNWNPFFNSVAATLPKESKLFVVTDFRKQLALGCEKVQAEINFLDVGAGP